MNEKALIRACQKGQKQAFEELIRAFYPYVSKFLLKMSGDESLSEDLTQETFLKMIRSMEQYDVDGSAGFGTWLITIARNGYIDHLRRNRISCESLDDLQLCGASDPSAEVMRKLQYEEVQKALSKLPKEQRLAIRMKYEEELTLSEIARQFGVPSKTVKSRIHDGTVKLRRLLSLHERNENDAS